VRSVAFCYADSMGSMISYLLAVGAGAMLAFFRPARQAE
jgi:hypothetical protein